MANTDPNLAKLIMGADFAHGPDSTAATIVSLSPDGGDPIFYFHAPKLAENHPLRERVAHEIQRWRSDPVHIPVFAPGEATFKTFKVKWRNVYRSELWPHFRGAAPKYWRRRERWQRGRLKCSDD